MPTPQEMIAYAGYGAITALQGVLHATSEQVRDAFTQSVETGIPLDRTPYQLSIAGMITGLTVIPTNSLWHDARSQFLVVLERYRDQIEHIDGMHMPQFRAAAANFLEAQQISELATVRLGARLGFPIE